MESETVTLKITVDTKDLQKYLRRVDVLRRVADLELDAQRAVDSLAELEARIKRIEEPRGL